MLIFIEFSDTPSTVQVYSFPRLIKLEIRFDILFSMIRILLFPLYIPIDSFSFLIVNFDPVSIP